MNAKEAARAYSASRAEEAEELSRDIESREREIETLLSSALDRDPRLTFDSLKQAFVPTPFDLSKWNADRPDWDNYQPQPLGFITRLMPGASRRREAAINYAKGRFEEDCRVYNTRVAGREMARAMHEEVEQRRENEVREHNRGVDALEAGLRTNEHSAVVDFYSALITKSLAAEIDAMGANVGYSPESRHLVVEIELPELGVIPEEASFKYVKSADRIVSQMRPVNKRRALYASLVNQSVLKCIDTVFEVGSEPQLIA